MQNINNRNFTHSLFFLSVSLFLSPLSFFLFTYYLTNFLGFTIVRVCMCSHSHILTDLFRLFLSLHLYYLSTFYAFISFLLSHSFSSLSTSLYFSFSHSHSHSLSFVSGCTLAYILQKYFDRI